VIIEICSSGLRMFRPRYMFLVLSSSIFIQACSSLSVKPPVIQEKRLVSSGNRNGQNVIASRSATGNLGGMGDSNHVSENKGTTLEHSNRRREVEIDGKKVIVSDRIILINFKEGIPNKIRQDIFDKYNLVITYFSPPDNYIVLAPVNSDFVAIARQINKSEYVESASVNYTVIISNHLAKVPNDDLFSYQDYLVRIGIDKAWRDEIIEQTFDQSEPIVGILDTGIDTDHTDLEGNLVTGHYFYYDPDLNKVILRNPEDNDGHGTVVAGIIGLVA